MDLPFTSGGTNCAATLFLPTEVKSTKLPCIVLGHGFGGVRKMLTPYAEAFAAQGWAALTFDYRNFGDSDGDNRQVLSVAGQLDDWRAAIKHARSLPEVDGDRIAIWGSSLGGGHVISIASEDHRVRAVVAQVPHISGWAAFRALGVLKTLLLAPFVALDIIKSLLFNRRYRLDLMGAPGSKAIMTGDDSSGFLKEAMRLAPGTCIQVAAASVLSIARYFPGVRIPNIRCPLLMLIANGDGTTPAAVALAAAKSAQHSEVLQYDCGHFDVYIEPIFSRAVQAQINFLKRHL